MNEHDLARDLARSEMILEKVKEDRYAQNLYSAMCNMQWQKLDVFPILKKELWAVTWRTAGGIVASLQGKGDYLNWYCSGINGDDAEGNLEYVAESIVTDEIRNDLKQLGWHPVPYDEDDN